VEVEPGAARREMPSGLGGRCRRAWEEAREQGRRRAWGRGSGGHGGGAAEMGGRRTAREGRDWGRPRWGAEDGEGGALPVTKEEAEVMRT
jgi:hypothetical protein